MLVKYVDTISGVVFFNGLYDIICGLSILRVLPNSFFATIHKSMFFDDSGFDHFLAYWILLNGMIRIIGGLNMKSPVCRMIVCWSYLLEAGFVANETYVWHNMHIDRGLFVIVFSLYLAFLSYRYIY